MKFHQERVHLRNNKSQFVRVVGRNIPAYHA